MVSRTSRSNSGIAYIGIAGPTVRVFAGPCAIQTTRHASCGRCQPVVRQNTGSTAREDSQKSKRAHNESSKRRVNRLVDLEARVYKSCWKENAQTQRDHCERGTISTERRSGAGGVTYTLCGKENVRTRKNRVLRCVPAEGEKHETPETSLAGELHST